MPLSATCPACNSSFKVRDEMAGKRGECPRCGATFRVSAQQGPPAHQQALPPRKPPARPTPKRTVPAPKPRPQVAADAPSPVTPPADDRLAAYRSRGRSLPIWIWFVLGGVGLAAALGAAVYSSYGPDQQPVARRQRPAERGPRLNMTPLAGAEAPVQVPALRPDASVEDVVEYCKSSVVKIYVYLDKHQTTPPQATGTGVIIDRSGLVATNYHVMEFADKADVKFKDGTKCGVLGYVALKPEYDLCIIQLNKVPEFVRALKIQGEGDPRDASEVIAIGHPHDFQFVATKGIVNAVVATRDLPEDYQQELATWLGNMPDNRWIQHDAATHEGNSGGPLLNAKGEVIGINSWITEELVAGNFAIHARHLRDALRDRFASVEPLSAHRRAAPPGAVVGFEPVDPAGKLAQAAEQAAATGWKPTNEQQYQAICSFAETLTAVKLAIAGDGHLDAGGRQALQQQVGGIERTLNEVEWDDDRIAAMNRMAAQSNLSIQSGTCFVGTVKQIYEGEAPVLRVNITGSELDVLMPVAVEKIRLLQGEVKPNQRLLVVGMGVGAQPVGDNPAQQEEVPVVIAGYVARFETH